jgi:MOSC domain-containing protein YiiM
MSAEGQLLGIARRRRSRGPMEALSAVRVTPELGVDGDARGRPGRRQVTVLARDGWEAALADAGATLPWTARRANLYVEGIDLAQAVGAELQVGASLRLRVTGETDPCARMDAAWPGLQTALAPDWRGGVTCRVIAGGDVAVGDPVVCVMPSSADHGVSGPVAGDGRAPV